MTLLKKTLLTASMGLGCFTLSSCCGDTEKPQTPPTTDTQPGGNEQTPGGNDQNQGSNEQKTGGNDQNQGGT